MAATQCVLDIMKENNFIEIIEYQEKIIHYSIQVKNITNEDIKKALLYLKLIQN